MTLKQNLLPPLVIFLFLLGSVAAVWFSGHVRVRETWTQRYVYISQPLIREEVVRQSSGSDVNEIISTFGPAPWETGYDRNRHIVPLGVETRHSGFGPAGPKPASIGPKENYHCKIEWL